MKLTKKHFEHTADTIRNMRQLMPTECWEIVVNCFAKAYADTNTKFNILKFKNACKGDRWSGK
jgi:hypothetical protein